MANNAIKGITIEIGGDTTGLDKALKGIDSQLRTTQKELKSVEKQLKLDPTNTELLEEKQRLLNETVRITSERMETLEKASAEAAKQLEAGAITAEQYAALQKELETTGKQLDAAKKAAGDFSVGLEKAKGNADKLAKAAQAVADKTKGISTAAAGALTGIAGMAINAVKASDDLNTLAKQSGFSTAEIQKFQYAADLIDVPAESIIASMKKIRSNMASDSAATQAAWDAIGVSVTNADGSLRNATDVFYEALAGLSQVGNETERDVLATQLFGKSADELAGIIDDGGASLQQLGQQAEDLGIILDQETLDSLNAVNDQLDTLKANAQGQIAKAGAEAMEALLPVFDEIIGALSSVLEWIGSLDADTLKFIITILAVVAAISPIAGIIASISGAVGQFLTVWPQIKAAGAAVKAFAAANPAVMIAGAVVALAAVVIANWDKIKPVLDAAFEHIKGIVNGVLGLFNRIIDGVNGVINGLNKIQMKPPEWFTALTGVGTFGLNLPTIPHIPLLAEGGLVHGGAAIVGERGAELLQMTDRGAQVTPLTNTNITNNYNATAPDINIKFTGNLAQLGRVLQPVIAAETIRRG